jgi:hypothetical protein
VPDDLTQLTEQIKLLVEKLNAPKKRDWSEKLATLTPFLATVVLAAISLIVTASNQKITIQNQKIAAERDNAFRNAQMRVAEIEALSKLVPDLSSKDPEVRKIARDVLQAVREASGTPASDSAALSPPPSSAEPSRPPEKTPKTEPPVRPASISVIDQFSALVLDPSAPTEARITAAEKITTAASAPGASPADRRHVEAVLTNVAQSPSAPPDLRSAAEKAITNIRQASASQIGDLIKAEPNSRRITEVILHHSSHPNIAEYKGYSTIKAIAMFQTHEFNWDRLGFHYIVAPDGTIWLGTPLSQVAFHAGRENATTVGVSLILDGDSELPTEPQRQALIVLLKSLFSKLDLKAETNFAPGHGFHHDYDAIKTCPGKLITKELVLSWLRQ